MKRGSLLDGERPMVRVALLGDQGLGFRARAVVQLVRDVEADLLVILGDYDYIDKPDEWRNQLGRLGHIPWFAVVGNHDLARWSHYQRIIAEEESAIQGALCTGPVGAQQVCRYRGLTMILSGIGTLGAQADNEAFVKAALVDDKSAWKLCLWHKNQHDMQLGAKTDEVGWKAYRACQEAGAIVVTGHEHSYARSRTLTAIGDMARGHGAIGGSNEMIVGEGKNFVTVSGLGGVETRPFVASHASDTWWAAFYTANRQLHNGRLTEENHREDGVGVFILDLGIDHDRKRGRGRFVTALDHRVFDDFSIRFE